MIVTLVAIAAFLFGCGLGYCFCAARVPIAIAHMDQAGLTTLADRVAKEREEQ